MASVPTSSTGDNKAHCMVLMMAPDQIDKEQNYGFLIATIEGRTARHVQVLMPDTVEQGVDVLTTEPLPLAIFLSNDGFTRPENARVLDAVYGYIRKGGIAIAMGNFITRTTSGRLNDFFGKAGLDWKTAVGPDASSVNETWGVHSNTKLPTKPYPKTPT